MHFTLNETRTQGKHDAVNFFAGNISSNYTLNLFQTPIIKKKSTHIHTHKPKECVLLLQEVLYISHKDWNHEEFESKIFINC